MSKKPSYKNDGVRKQEKGNNGTSRINLIWFVFLVGSVRQGRITHKK